MRRILTACFLSFLALLGAVSIDLSSNFDLLHTSEAAYDELTSCRMIAVLQLVGKLQEMRRLFANEMSETSLSEVVLPMFDRFCAGMAGGSNGRGMPCSGEAAGFCQGLWRSAQGLLNSSLDTSEDGASAYSSLIEELLNTWSTVEDALVKVKRSLNWKDVLSARLVVAFAELNHQLRDSPHLATRPDFQHRWSYVLSYLGFARIMSEHLNDCWFENIDLKLNSSQRGNDSSTLDTHLWHISGTESELLSGSSAGLKALADAQRCLFDRAVPALRLASRSVSSALSMRICLLTMACLIYPVVMFSFKQMTEWIQNYAQSLTERTEDLKRQRRLAEDLLHQMLPKSVAKQLRKHKHVEAESYDKVGATAQKNGEENMQLVACFFELLVLVG